MSFFLFQYDCVDVKSGDLMGYFFLDLHPRDGKYGHACVHGLQPGCINVQTVSYEFKKSFSTLVNHVTAGNNQVTPRGFA